MSNGASREKGSGLAGEERFHRQDCVECAALSRRQGSAVRQLFDQDGGQEYYEKAKQEQKTGRFFPERYQHGGYELVEAVIDRYLLTIATKKPTTQVAERFFAQWWKDYFKGKRLNSISVGVLEEARQSLLARVVTEAKEKGDMKKLMTPQRVNRYMEWMRHVVDVVVREGKLASNPVHKLTMYKEPKEKHDSCRWKTRSGCWRSWDRFMVRGHGWRFSPDSASPNSSGCNGRM